MAYNRKVFSSYFKGMSAKKKHELEKESLSDSFLSDALDGFHDHPHAVHQLRELDKKYFRNKNAFWKTTVLISLPILLFVVYQFIPKNKAIDIQHKSSIPFKYVPIKRIPPKEIESFVAIPKEKQLAPKTIQLEFQEKDKGMIFQTNENPVFPSDELVRIPIKSIDKLERIAIQKKQNFAMETYVQDLKVLDYRYYRKKVLQEKTNLLTGTPAAQETKNAEKNETDDVAFGYMNFLSVTLRDFNQGEFKAALIGFDQILSTYPDDVNALFYSALCLYNLKQFALCEQRLHVMDLAKFDNFDEEQKWYLLLCYRAEGKSEAFLYLKKEIILQNGFYASKANALTLK
jgi:hypothetical protein